MACVNFCAATILVLIAVNAHIVLSRPTEDIGSDKRTESISPSSQDSTLPKSNVLTLEEQSKSAVGDMEENAVGNNAIEINAVVTSNNDNVLSEDENMNDSQSDSSSSVVRETEDALGTKECVE